MEPRKLMRRKTREGVVTSNKMQKTVIVNVERRIRHPQFEKAFMRSKKYYAHNDIPDVAVGTKVRIVETRPLSKLKRWRVTEVIA